MTSIADAARRAVATVTAARAHAPQPAAQTGMSVRPYSPPALSPELKRELARALAGPLVLPGSGNGDAAMILHPYLIWQPEAASIAEDLRAGMAAPAAREVVEQWLTTLAMCVVNAPTDPAAAEMQCAAVWRLCGQFPAAVWSDESLDAYCDANKYWPAPAELRQFFNGRVALIEQQIDGFDRIAKAPRETSSMRSAFGSRAYLDGLLASGASCVPPERPAHWSSPRPGIADDFDDMKGRSTFPFVDPARTVEQQFAALGVTREEAAAQLQAKNAERGAK